MRTYLGDMYTVLRELEDINNLGCGGDDDHLTGAVGTASTTAASKEDSIPGWGVAVIVIVSVMSLALCSLVAVMVTKERAGSPLFSKMMQDSV
jgi:hypothetical protein